MVPLILQNAQAVFIVLGAVAGFLGLLLGVIANMRLDEHERTHQK